MELTRLLKPIKNNPRVILFRETLKHDVEQINLAVDRNNRGRRIQLYLSSFFHALKSSLQPMNSIDLSVDDPQQPINTDL